MDSDGSLGSEGDLSLDENSGITSDEDSEAHESVIRPFMYEPEASDSSSSSSADGESSDGEDSDRLSNNNWCLCGGYCSPMPTVAESICCCEIPAIQGKKDAVQVNCITLHPGFPVVCLDVWVLQTAYYSLRQHYGSQAPQGTIDQKYRHTAYRQLVRWCWSWLGSSVRVPLPSCAVSKIRNTFPSEMYTGFKYPEL